MRLQKSGYKGYKIAYKMAQIETKSQIKIFEDYKKFMEAFSILFPKYKLIVRPHPSENHAKWKEILKKL